MVQSVIKNRGIALLEIVLAIALFAVITLGVFYLSIDTVQRDSKIELESQALYYAQEGLEAIRNMRDRNFLSITTNGDHGLQFLNNAWSFIEAPENIDNFYSRRINIEDVYRDENGNIASQGTPDPDTKKITSEVSWLLRGVIPKSVSLVTYLSNWTGDDLIQTTCSEFNQGTFTDTEIITDPTPPSDNCSIEITDIENPSEFFSSVDLGKHSNDVVVDGDYLYVAQDSSQNGFAIIDVTNRQAPVIKSQLYTSSKGNKITKSGTKVYMGIKIVNPAISIINVANVLAPAIEYAWQLAGVGNEPAVNNGYLYTTAEANNNAFSVYSLSPVPTLKDTLSFGDSVYSVKINGNYAYLGIADDSNGFKVVDISTPTNIFQVASKNVGEEVNAIDISGYLAFIGTEDSSSSLKVMNISNPLNPTLVTSLDVGGEIQDLVVQGDFLYAAIDDQNSGLAAINISNPLSPTLAYNLDIQGKGTGIDADENYVYISTDTANKGVVIVGTTVSGTANTGDYISQTFDTGSTDTRYNFISWNHIEVPGGTLKFQLRTADTLANLNNATWVGSDGTSSTYYETPRTPIVLDPNRTGSRYFQFKAFFTSDGVTSPSLESVQINFNP